VKQKLEFMSTLDYLNMDQDWMKLNEKINLLRIKIFSPLLYPPMLNNIRSYLQDFVLVLEELKKFVLDDERNSAKGFIDRCLKLIEITILSLTLLDEYSRANMLQFSYKFLEAVESFFIRVGNESDDVVSALTNVQQNLKLFVNYFMTALHRQFNESSTYDRIRIVVKDISILTQELVNNLKQNPLPDSFSKSFALLLNKLNYISRYTTSHDKIIENIESLVKDEINFKIFGGHQNVINLILSLRVVLESIGSLTEEDFEVPKLNQNEMKYLSQTILGTLENISSLTKTTVINSMTNLFIKEINSIEKLTFAVTLIHNTALQSQTNLPIYAELFSMILQSNQIKVYKKGSKAIGVKSILLDSCYAIYTDIEKSDKSIQINNAKFLAQLYLNGMLPEEALFMIVKQLLDHIDHYINNDKDSAKLKLEMADAILSGIADIMITKENNIRFKEYIETLESYSTMIEKSK